jgi:hypothetical protein
MLAWQDRPFAEPVDNRVRVAISLPHSSFRDDGTSLFAKALGAARSKKGSPWIKMVSTYL